MFKEKWKKFADRFGTLGVSRAEATRATGINYSKLVGFLNGYWDLNDEETEELERYLTETEAARA